jgi:hypothetical protein
MKVKKPISAVIPEGASQIKKVLLCSLSKLGYDGVKPQLNHHSSDSPQRTEVPDLLIEYIVTAPADQPHIGDSGPIEPGEERIPEGVRHNLGDKGDRPERPSEEDHSNNQQAHHGG